jgi:hypothetical protein
VQGIQAGLLGHQWSRNDLVSDLFDPSIRKQYGNIGKQRQPTFGRVSIPE